MVRLKSALRRILLTHCSIWLLLTAALPAIAVAETQYLYDDLGRLVLVAYPDGSAIAYEHDADGNIVAQHQWTAAGPVIATFSPHARSCRRASHDLGCRFPSNARDEHRDHRGIAGDRRFGIRYDARRHRSAGSTDRADFR